MSELKIISMTPTPPDFDVITVTPELAGQWLKQNKRNRGIRPNVVASYARDMLEGRWKFAGDPIRRAPDGTLLDGQHRLLAIQSSGVSVDMLVINGLPKDAQAAMDLAIRRQPADMLRIEGYTGDLNRMQAVARQMMMFDKATPPTPMQVLEFIRENLDELTNSISMIRLCQDADVHGGALIGAAYMRCYRIDPDDADEFFSKLASGAELPQASPILSLRNYLLKTKFRSINVVNSRRLQSVFFNAWNQWRLGRSLRKIYIPRDTIKPR